jgi:hypothetical protein
MTMMANNALHPTAGTPATFSLTFHVRSFHFALHHHRHRLWVSLIR